MSIGNIKDYTPNYKFIIPKFDTATWHDYIESNFRSIDALLYNIFVVNGYKGEWTNSTLYEVGSVVFIGDNNGDFTGKLFKVLVEHTTPNDGNFETFYENNPDKYEQFADFDAAERAAQLAKDWANKMSGTVDGLEYSAKYYAQLAQQTVDSKANDNEVVHISGNEYINGEKIFTSNIKVSKSSPLVDLYNTNITKGTAPSSLQIGRNAMLDKDGKCIALTQYQYLTDGRTEAILRTYHPNNESNYAQIAVNYRLDGRVYTEAPTPTDTTTTNGTQIATTGWVNSTGNNVVHLTGFEAITGYKSFQTQVEFDSPNMIQGTDGSGYGIEFYDKNSNRFGFLRPHATTSTNVLSLCATRAVNGQIKFSAVDATVDSSGNCYIKVPNSDVNGSVVTTINKSKAINGYFQLGNGLIIQWGKSTATSSSGKVTLPKAFSSTNYAVVINDVMANVPGSQGSGANLVGWGVVSTRTTTNFTAFLCNYENSCWWKCDWEGRSFTWIAIGY